MHADRDLDVDVPCWICDGDGTDPVTKTDLDGTELTFECRFCAGTGIANHFGPSHPGPQGRDADGDHVIMRAWVDEQTGALHVHRLTVDHPTMPAFDQRFGPSTNADLSGPPKADYEADIRDQLQNKPLGTGTPYPSGLDKSAFPGGTWPADGDLTINQAIALYQGRDRDHRDDGLVAGLKEIKARLDL